MQLYFLSNYTFCFLFVLHFHFYITKYIFRYVTVFRTVEIIKDCNLAMPPLNMLMYSKIIKPFVHVQNMPRFYTVLIKVDFIL